MNTDRILLVDDNDGQRITLESILSRAGFNVQSADCGTAAIEASKEENFAAVLLDIKMPDMTGIEVLKSVKKKRPDTTVIMMTGYAETEYAIDALNHGAAAYLLKPANIEQIKMLLRQALDRIRLIEENRALTNALREWNNKLEKKVEERTSQLRESNRMTLAFYEELKKNFESTIEVLSIAIDQRDPLTCSHSFRVTEYALEIGRSLNLNNEDLDKLRYSGLLHDLGKIEIKPEILCKDGSLTQEEYKEIQTHAHETFTLLSKFKFKRGLQDVPMIASSHHERFDGSGYPRQLKGEAIPFMARVLAVADVLDAITSKRHYRTAMAVNDALAIMKRESGGHFDPQCVEALFEVNLAEFTKIHMAEFLEQLDSNDLVALMPYKLKDLYAMVKKENGHSEEEMTLLQCFHKYYQGPVPGHLKGLIQPAPNFNAKAA